MPELPEVETTVKGLQKSVVGLKITDVWSDYDSKHHRGDDNIKDPRYFARFRRAIVGTKIISAERRAKNVLILLDNKKTILVHMKMTGHLLYGKYERSEYRDPIRVKWLPIRPKSLKDPFNRHIHFAVTFSNGNTLALSDSRKFAKVTLLETARAHETDHLNSLGPEPLDKEFGLGDFLRRLHLRPRGKIKQVLMDQEVVSGIGNIYADESLWRAGIHPLERVSNIDERRSSSLLRAIKTVLSRGIDLGGDSMSDYRNIAGERGKFQEHHCAYRRTGEKCRKRGCSGTIRRITIGSRSAHFCDKHQRLHAGAT